MAAAFPASCRRAVLFGTRLCGPSRVGSRPFSDQSNRNGVLLVDTLALVRKLEEKGMPTEQAEGLTELWVDVVNSSLETITHSLVSKAEMDKIVMRNESNLSKFRTEVTSSEEHRFSLLQHEVEKLRSDIEKMQSELKYEIDKVTAGQRLDLNLEKGRIRDELNNQQQENKNLNTKIDRETHDIKALFEAAKYDVIKYCMGTVASISAVGLALLRIML